MSSKNHKVVEGLGKLLAETYLLMLKTHNYHWNVTGPHFQSLHTLFQTQYEDLFTAVDEMAERLRALGEPAPGSFAKFSELSGIKEETGSPKADDMVKALANDNEKLSETCNALVKAAQEVGDEVTADLAIGRMTIHDKTTWMLKSHLG